MRYFRFKAAVHPIITQYFLQHNAMLACYIPWPCVRVCLSATSLNCTQTAKRRNMHTIPHDSPWTLQAKDLDEIRTGSPNSGGVG